MRIATLILSFMLSIAACAQGNSVERFQEGVHYNVLAKPVKTITPGKIEVTEAFSFSCGHCFNFEPLLLAWKKKAADDIAVVKLPVIWRPYMEVLARSLYTGEALGISDKVNQKVFMAIHVEKRNVATEADALKIFTELGVAEENFKKTFNSFGVSSKVQQADARTRAMGVTGTPQLIIDGKYSIAASPQVDHAGMLQVADFLIDKIRSEAK